MRIKKISAVNNQEDAIVRIFTACRGDILKELIPAEYDALLVRYEEIKRRRSKPSDLPGQQTLWKENNP